MMADRDTLRAFCHAMEQWDDLTFRSASLDQIPFQKTCSRFFKPETTYVSHFHYSDAQQWTDAGYSVLQNGRSISEKYDFAALFPQKDKDAALFQLQSMLQNLKKNVEFVVVAHNDAGGKRLSKWLGELGCDIIDEITKYHCRAVRAQAPESLSTKLSPQFYKGPHGLMTAAGIFGADKIDVGSALLLHCLPKRLTGKIADFGCGYGYLAKALHETADQLYAYDNDWRAVEATKQNVPEAETIWWDLTVKPEAAPFDTIVMNPPFHEGKSESVALGQKLIAVAADALRKGGALYMVANRHLPYERILAQHFAKITLLREKQGFKVYEGIR